MDSQRVRELQEEIVHAISGNVSDVMEGEWEDREWVHLFVNYELDPGGERSSSITFSLAHRPGQPLERVSFRLPIEAKHRLKDLADAMHELGQDRWSTVDIRIEGDGRFTFAFGHDVPWRLSGNLIDKRFEGYQDDWLLTDDGVRFSQAVNPHGSPESARQWLRSMFRLKR